MEVVIEDFVKKHGEYLKAPEILNSVSIIQMKINKLEIERNEINKRIKKALNISISPKISENVLKELNFINENLIKLKKQPILPKRDYIHQDSSKQNIIKNEESEEFEEEEESNSNSKKKILKFLQILHKKLIYLKREKKTLKMSIQKRNDPLWINKFISLQNDINLIKNQVENISENIKEIL